MNLNQVVGKKILRISYEDFTNFLFGYRYVVIDLGTGDGKFAYRYAISHPDTFVIGIDASETEMMDISHKSSRKPAKGGLQNIIYLKQSAEQIPDQLEGIADQIFVNFPWGSLLKGVLLAEQDVMSGILKMAKPGAQFELLTTYDEKFEPKKIADQDLPELNKEYFEEKLDKLYSKLGIKITNVIELDPEQKKVIESTWAKKILSQRDRIVYKVLTVITK